MTPSPPDEALHFRGKTLTPESPRPLHIPEPANIPVLENQMDPVFNDTSTYEHLEYTAPSQVPDGWAPTGRQVQGMGPGSLRGAQVMDDKTNFYPLNPASEQSGPTNPNGFADSTVSLAPPVVPVSQGLASASDLENAEPARVSDRLDDGKEHAGSNVAGVNLQSLLDNLSGAPLEGSLHQAPEPAQPQSLPARPLQDPLHPIYTPGDVSYQHIPSDSAAPTYATQPSNQPSQPYPQSMSPGGAPGTVSGSGSLPPPPTASFQHIPSAGGESHISQENDSQLSRKGKTDKQVVRPGKGVDDDSPWGPEVQKKYDEFLHDERIYVTEGLWDRFPMGSRLFVGSSQLFPICRRGEYA